ncbi:MAG: hypothetical protein ABID38_02845 [Candidatus Diapherotrites archaeon]
MPEEAKEEKSNSGKIILIIAGIFVVGSALLVIFFIMIAALFAFGIFNPPVSSRCAGLDRLMYADHSATYSEITLALGNGAGSSINIADVTLGGDFAGGAASYAKESIGTGRDFQIGAKGLNLNGTYSGTIAISYKTASGSNHMETATCTGSV